MNRQKLIDTARMLVAGDKGIDYFENSSRATYVQAGVDFSVCTGQRD